MRETFDKEMAPSKISNIKLPLKKTSILQVNFIVYLSKVQVFFKYTSCSKYTNIKVLVVYNFNTTRV